MKLTPLCEVVSKAYSTFTQLQKERLQSRNLLATSKLKVGRIPLQLDYSIRNGYITAVSTVLDRSLLPENNPSSLYETAALASPEYQFSGVGSHELREAIIKAMFDSGRSVIEGLAPDYLEARRVISSIDNAQLFPRLAITPDELPEGANSVSRWSVLDLAAMLELAPGKLVMLNDDFTLFLGGTQAQIYSQVG